MTRSIRPRRDELDDNLSIGETASGGLGARAAHDPLLFGRLANGGKVTVGFDTAGKVRLEFAEEPASVV